jgi:hypothetical protein
LHTLQSSAVHAVLALVRARAPLACELRRRVASKEDAMTQQDARRREPARRDEDDERGPLISSESDETPRPGRRFEQLEDWQKPRELTRDRDDANEHGDAQQPARRSANHTEGQRSSARRKAH